MQDSEGECCDRCRAEPRCNVWNFCADASGCGPTVVRSAALIFSRRIRGDAMDCGGLPGTDQLAGPSTGDSPEVRHHDM